MVMESTLLDRYLKRAYSNNDKPHTKQSLKEQCEREITRDGPQARSVVLLKGQMGRGLKLQRRIFPDAPLGEVVRSGLGRLTVEFPSMSLLAALEGYYAAHAALAWYYLRSIDTPYPKNIEADLALQFAQEHLSIEIDLDIIEAVIASNRSNPIFGNSFLVFTSLFEIERTALMRRWKSVDLQKWRAAKLTRPLWERPAPRSTASIEVGALYKVKERHAKLLHLYDQADEAGKQHIEQAAAFAAAKKNASGPMVKA